MTIERSTPGADSAPPQPLAGGPLPRRHVLPCRTTLALILGLAAARLAYLIRLCPYDLIEDEAHYWEWSRRLDWSYYSKGPGVALAIRAATSIFGEAEWAVRLPAVIASAALMLVAACLASDVAGGGERGKRAGLFAAAAIALAPMLQLVGIMITIDGPYIACWALACWAAWRAMMREGSFAWPLLGAALGLGFLFKYTILLLPPGLLLFAFLCRPHLHLARRWRSGLVLSIVIALSALAPVVIWNAERSWPTIRHLLGHLGVQGGDVAVAPGSGGFHLNLVEPMRFIGEQIGMVGPGLVLALIAAIGAWRSRHANPLWPGRAFLVAAAVPLLLFYLVVAALKEAEGNWAMAAYTTLLPLAALAAADAMTDYRARVAAWLAEPRDDRGRRPKRGILRRKPETAGQMLWHAALVYGLIGGLLMLRVDWLATVPPKLGLKPATIPVHRFIGAREMAAHAQELLDALRAKTGQEPFVIARHYGRASVLAYYLHGHPTVYCSSSRMEGRMNQYDLWPQTGLDDPSLRGRPALLVGDGAPLNAANDPARVTTLWAEAFERVELVGTLRGDGKRGRPALLGFGYRGFPVRSQQADSGGPAR